MIESFNPNLKKHVNRAYVCITLNCSETYQQYIQNKACFIEVIKVKNE